MYNVRTSQALSGRGLSLQDTEAKADIDSHGQATAPPPGDESGPVVNFESIRDYARLILGAIRRHVVLALAVIVLVVAMTAALAIILPKTYRVEAKLLAQRNSVMTALSNPGRAIPWDADAPTRAAAETVLRRDNLISLVKQTNLLERSQKTRAPLVRFTDWAFTTVFGVEVTDEDKLDELIDLLEERLNVETGSTIEGTVTISIDWPDGQLAYELVQAAQQAFLEARQVAETSAIAESISILERYSATLHEEIERTIAESEQAQSRSSSRVVRRAAPASSALSAASASAAPSLPSMLAPSMLNFTLETDPEVGRLKSQLTMKRQEIQSLEEMRQRQMVEAQTRLTQLRTIYTDTHPSVLDAQQNISSLSRESPQLMSLRAQEQSLTAEYERRQAAATLIQEEDLKAQYQSRLAAQADGRPAEPRAEPRPAPAAAPRLSARDQDDYSTLLFRLQLSQLQNVLERTDGARIELAVSQAAFKYRYTVVRPAQVPREPAAPKLFRILVSGVFAAFMLALSAVVYADFRSKRIFEPWQLERQLGLPTLGVLKSA